VLENLNAFIGFEEQQFYTMPDTLEVDGERGESKKRSWQITEEASHEVKMLKHM
jgi:hypothetical protein